ncbi:MAG: MOFRL family protein, partial [Chloroflexota bacterium]
GPTVPNPTTQADALAVLKKYGLLEKVPPPILAALLRRKKNGRNVNVAAKNTMIIGSNQISAEAAKERATHEGFETHILTTSLQGEASEKGRELADYLRKTKQRPLCVIVGGETTVLLGDAEGLGGRNQEMALAAVEILSGVRDMMLITLATDGDDGPTDAAGAVVTGDTYGRAKELGLDLEAHLREHNAYPFFETLGDLLIPGPTGTNVNDLAFLFAF